MISVIVPVYNEEEAIEGFLKQLECALSSQKDYEIIVVDDGSTDKTPQILENLKLKSAKFIKHVENIGYGKSLLDGIAVAKNECIAIIDGDGSYPVERIDNLLEYYPQYDMVVGARQGMEYKRGIFKRPARFLFSYLAKYASGRDVPDVNSGLRVFKRSVALKFKDFICTGFSFTTTITLLFMLNHYFVKYIPVEYKKREGKSKVSHFKDTLRAGQIIVQTIVYYNPIKLFLLIGFYNALFGFMLGVVNHYFIESIMLSVAAGVCISSFVPIFVLGLVAERLKRIS